MTKRFSFSGCAAAAAVLATVLGSSPARADRCDDLAKDLTNQIPGLKIGKTVAGVIYLEHPAVTQASLGCSSRNRTKELILYNKIKKNQRYFKNNNRTI